VNHGDPVGLVKNSAQALINNAPAKITVNSVVKSGAKYIFEAMKAKCDANTKMVVVAQAHDGLAMAIPEENAVSGSSELLTRQTARGYLKIVAGP